ncbi:Por secretion system C-terminal sorting domain-containing protein [Algibacter lectus]|uniref:T9SS type A sorting domain-containing protein n=1 Tax=Algibacter lectus TaxID=221126 RepID=UPI0008E43AA2|nr:T9SS type A sorting domain-containing protein [Algibacter lectus]SFD25805.1 Por secretion system C-terminal sorting domain-containing protein [Algibacter lectus]
MKLKLLLLLLVTSLGYSQNSIPTFESAAGSEFAVVSAPTDQSAAGANATWTFNVTYDNQNTSDEYSTTDAAISNYPGSTAVINTSVGNSPISKIFLEKSGTSISFTGAESNGFTLVYTDKGELGSFPLSYLSAPSNDNISGTFNYSSYNGTFSGSLVRTVDAKGTLNVNISGLAGENFSGGVTRLKTVQDIQLFISFGGFPVKAADLTQTSYYYYKDNGDLVFRSTKIDVSGDAINDSFETAESLITSTLGLGDHTISDADFSILTNPVKEELNINVKAEVESISIVDLSGRQVLNVKTNERKLVVDQLKSGLYIANIATDKGMFSQKFVKQ